MVLTSLVHTPNKVAPKLKIHITWRMHCTAIQYTNKRLPAQHKLCNCRIYYTYHYRTGSAVAIEISVHSLLANDHREMTRVGHQNSESCLQLCSTTAITKLTLISVIIPLLVLKSRFPCKYGKWSKSETLRVFLTVNSSYIMAISQ